jgi:probable F420-dependent oxidoreductase
MRLAKPDIGIYGVWVEAEIDPICATEVEKLGYGTIWIGSSPSADLSGVESVLDRTARLKVATSVINIWSSAAEEVADSFHRVDRAHPGRFILGIGAGHPEINEIYRSPYQTLCEYLNILDHCRVPSHRRVIAALGPKLIALAGRRAAGAIPYNTTPTHTQIARHVLGPSALIAPEHKVVVSTDLRYARTVGRKRLDFYAPLANYVRNWKRLGFDEADIMQPLSDRLVDALVAHGTPRKISRSINEHLEHGADHVAIQVLGSADQFLPSLAELAHYLGSDANA